MALVRSLPPFFPWRLYQLDTLCYLIFSLTRPSESPGRAQTVLDTVYDCCVFAITSGGTRRETVDQAERPSLAYAHMHPRTTHTCTFGTQPTPQPKPSPLYPPGAAGGLLPSYTGILPLPFPSLLRVLSQVMLLSVPMLPRFFFFRSHTVLPNGA